MNRKTTLLAAACCLITTGNVMADASDWYISGGGSYINSDERRANDNDFSGYFGIGRYLGEKFGIELDYNSYEFDLGAGSNVDIDGWVVTGRYYMLGNTNTSPYLALGVGSMDHDGPNGDNSDAVVDLGLGVDYPFAKRWSARAEVVYRLDSDNTSISDEEDDFDDYQFNFGLTYAFGDRSGAPEPAPVSEPVAPAVTDTDSDNDGVVDRIDRCPGTPAGTSVDRHGCPMDGDKDGVVDVKDECKDTPEGNIVDETGCNKELLVELKGVHFGFDKATLTDEAMAILDMGADTLAKHGHIRISIEGHTDSRGSESYNRGLSERRAQAVLNYMNSKGVSRDRMDWVGHGESKPVDSNDTEDGRANNRRVELRILNNK